MKSLQFVTFLAIPLLLTSVGCATRAPADRWPAFSANSGDLTPVNCRIVVPQQEVVLAAKEGTYTPTGGGLVGILFDAAATSVQKGINAARQSSAAERVQPLVNKGLAELFRERFGTLVGAAIQSSSWLKSSRVDLNAEDRNVTTTEVANSPVLDVRVICNLSIDASMFTAQARVRYFRRGQNTPVYYRYFTYYSDRIAIKRDEEAIAIWAANGEELYRSAASEGAAELVRMISMHFLSPQQLDTSQNEAKITLYDAAGNSERTWKGKILDRDGQRIVFQEASLANIFSLMPKTMKDMK